MHSGLATCKRGVRMVEAGFLRAGWEGRGKAKRGGDLMEPSVQVAKRAAKGATAWL